MFRKNHAAPAKARRVTSFSVIGPDVVVTGDIVTGENLEVSGRIDGNVRCAALNQAEGGIIAGNVAASELQVAGTITGTVTAGVVAIAASACVDGEIIYTTLSIEAGARVEGRFEYRAPQTDAMPDAVAFDDIFPHDDTVAAHA